MDWPDDDSLISGSPVEIRLDNPCAACGKRTVLNIIVNLRLPIIGNAVQTTYICESCGFKHSDVIMLENRGPLRYEAFVEHDLSLRVIRSNSGTLRIPELGVHIEPGVASESFVTNAEGVLERVEGVVRALRVGAEKDVCEKCDRLLETISSMREGAIPFHIIVEDPYGNSALIGQGVTVTHLTDEEASSLSTGEMSFESTNSWKDKNL
ncbi:MAG: ZPR1 zinc finger domain-containing protein [Methanomassiliicoccales archaeon]